MKEPKRFFSEISNKYIQETYEAGKTLSYVGRNERTRQVLKLIDKYCDQDATVADIGCGPGQFVHPIINRGYNYIGMDINREMFRECSENFKSNQSVIFKFGRIEDIPLPNKNVDCLICVGVIEYVKNYFLSLKEINRILKKSGIAIITFPNIRFPLNKIRATTRHILAPILNKFVPGLRDTIFVSGIYHRIFDPNEIIELSNKIGFKLVEELSDGYAFTLINHKIKPFEITYRHFIDKIGTRLFPKHGSNYYICLRKL